MNLGQDYTGRMQMNLKFKIVVILAAFILIVSGCGLIEKDSTEGKVIDGKDVVASVNEEHVSKSDFDIQADRVKTALEANGQDFSTAEGKKNFQEIKKKVLDSMIRDIIALQQAKKSDVSLKEGQLEEAIVQLEAYHGGKDALDNYLKNQNMDRAEFSELLKEQLIINNLKEKLTSDITVTDDDVKKYYNENSEMFKLSSPEIRASHILVATEDEAKKVLSQLKEGKDFAELAKKYSTDNTTSVEGGDLGFFGKGQMVPEFEKAAFALKPGEISDIVKSEFGYHIIKVTGERSSLKLEDVETYIKNNLESSEKEEKFNKLLDEWQKQSKIEKYL
jgi:foldase protein PrsA